MHINNGNLPLASVAALQPKYFISTAIYIVHLPLKHDCGSKKIKDFVGHEW